MSITEAVAIPGENIALGDVVRHQVEVERAKISAFLIGHTAFV